MEVDMKAVLVSEIEKAIDNINSDMNAHSSLTKQNKEVIGSVVDLLARIIKFKSVDVLLK